MKSTKATLWGGSIILAYALIASGCYHANRATIDAVITQWGLFEKTLTSTHPYSKTQKYKEVILNATFIAPNGVRYKVPGFWDGGGIWRIRFSPLMPGRWTYTIDSTDSQLDARENDGSFIAVQPSRHEMEANPNYRGFLKLSSNRRFLTYGDGTPFFWLGDTTWDGNSKNMPYQTDFKLYVDNRKEKGFSVLQILVAEPSDALNQRRLEGCKPPRYTGCNEAGYVYEVPSLSYRLRSRLYRALGFAIAPYPEEINPESFQNLDLRLKYILDQGMVPYIVFAWAADFGALSTASLKSYVKYIIARYQAYNVIWCISGEHYLVKDKSNFKAIGDYVHEIDALQHLTTIHGWTQDFVGEPWLDFVSATAWDLPEKMYEVLFKTLERPGVPFVMAESRYDGNEPTAAYGPRKYALEALTAGAMGYTYGADGVWNWGVDPRYPDPRARLDIQSSSEMNRIAEFFTSLEWWKLSPANGLADPGRVLAEPERQYLVWINGGGPTTLALPARRSRFSAVWFDPTRGTKKVSTGITAGVEQTFQPPFGGDALLHVTLDPGPALN